MWRVMCTWVGYRLSTVFQVGQCERDQLSPPSISHHLVLRSVLTEALIIAPRGHRGSSNSWVWEMDLLMSICPFVCQSPTPPTPVTPHFGAVFTVSAQLECSPLVHHCVSSFLGKTARRAFLAPFHIYSGSGFSSQLPVGHSVFKCSCYKWI